MYFDKLEDYRDVESFNAYKEMTETFGVSHEEMMGYLKKIGRDNARTPMQWDDSENAGFTTGTPWIRVNPNYLEINAKQQVGNGCFACTGSANKCYCLPDFYCKA